MTNVIGYIVQCEIHGDPFWWEGAYLTTHREDAHCFLYKEGAEQIARTRVKHSTARVVPVESKDTKE